MVKKTIVQEATIEVKKDIDTIVKAREKQSKKEPDFKMSNRAGGIKIVLWISFGYIVYNIYSYTPLKNKINELFEEDFF